MSIADVAFVVGQLGAVVLVPLAVAGLAVGRRPRWALRVGAVLMLLVATCWSAYWLSWGRAFEIADALREVPAALEWRLEVWSAATAVTAAALVVTAACTLGRRTASERHHGDASDRPAAAAGHE